MGRTATPLNLQMTYRTAQKLKELGFPQEGNGKKVLVENKSEGLSYWLYYPTEEELAQWIIDNNK